MILADAPGKLFVAGEYAVLDGAPAIAVAVDVRAQARIDALPGTGSQLVLPDTGQAFPFRWLAGVPPRWESGSPGAFGRPLEAVAVSLYERGLLPRNTALPACRIELVTAAFHYSDASGHRQKLGLGSSAAVTVALAGALLRHARIPVPQREQLLAVCLDAHRRMQGGAGSGVDVATALAGGVLGLTFAAAGAAPQLVPLVWPRQLHMVAVWSGHAASTTAMLARLRLYRERQPTAHGGHLQRLGAVAAHLFGAWRAGDVQAILAGLANYDQALRKLDADTQLGIYSREHGSLRKIALEHAAVYKPSGAGGGDFGIAFADSRTAIQAARSAFETAGYLCLDAPVGAAGLGVTQAGAEPALP